MLTVDILGKIILGVVIVADKIVFGNDAVCGFGRIENLMAFFEAGIEHGDNYILTAIPHLVHQRDIDHIILGVGHTVIEGLFIGGINIGKNYTVIISVRHRSIISGHQCYFFYKGEFGDFVNDFFVDDKTGRVKPPGDSPQTGAVVRKIVDIFTTDRQIGERDIFDSVSLPPLSGMFTYPAFYKINIILIYGAFVPEKHPYLQVFTGYGI